MFHPKGTIDPAGLLEVGPLLDQGYELVIGSRMLAGGSNEEDGRLLKPRKWFVLALALAAATLWRREGNVVWDVLHGFRAMRRDTFFSISPLQRGLSIDLEMVVRSYRHGLRRIEFPVGERARPEGRTHFPAVTTGAKLLRYLLFELTRRSS